MSLKTELESLKQKADLMGVSYHANIGVEKLKAKIESYTGGAVEEIEVPKGQETLGQKKARLRKESDVRIRVKVNCLNPMKQSYDGEIFEAGNSYIGTIKVFVPFNVEAWYLPKIIIDLLREKQYQHHYEETVNGKKINKQKWVKEFNVVELEPLTKKELDELAATQRANHSID